MSSQKSTVFLAAFAFNKPTLLKIVNNHRNITAASKDFFSYITLGQWSKVVNRFKNPKLTYSQTNISKMAVSTGSYRFSRTHKFDIGIQRPYFLLTPLVMYSHNVFISNSLTLNYHKCFPRIKMFFG